MTSITIGKKVHALKRTLTRGEVKYILQNSAYIANFQNVIEKGDVKELMKISNEVNTMAPDVAKFIDKCICECYDITIKELDKIENTTILHMQSELYQVSTTLKKT